MAVLQTLLDIAPQFEALNQENPDRITRVIAIAQAQLNESFWGNLWEYASALLTAHILTLSERSGNGASGQITSETEGDLSLSFGALEQSQWNSTWYGAELLKLMRRKVGIVARTAGFWSAA